MIRHFTLERVNKAPASFDPQKLLAFQERHMRAVPLAQKVASGPAVPAAGRIGPLAAAQRLWAETGGPRAGRRRPDQGRGRHPGLRRFLHGRRTAAVRREGVRQATSQAGRGGRLADEVPRAVGARGTRSTPGPWSSGCTISSPARASQIGQIIHALRVAVTGKAVGFGMFETLAILGRERRCGASIGRGDWRNSIREHPGRPRLGGNASEFRSLLHGVRSIAETRLRNSIRARGWR